VLHLFGDESSFGTATTYAIVIVNAEQQLAMEMALSEVKVMFGGSPELRIHCRELFNAHARAKTGWQHLNNEDALQLLSVAGNYLRTAGTCFNVGVVDRSTLPKNLEIPIQGKKYAIPAGPKQMAAFAYTLALAGLEKEEFRLWIDPDTTKIEWGGARRQAGRVPLTFDGIAITPESFEGTKPPLLDVADVLAYSAAHSLCKTSPDRRFRQAFESFGSTPRQLEFHHQVFPE
jgi:hypothetical protein